MTSKKIEKAKRDLFPKGARELPKLHDRRLRNAGLISNGVEESRGEVREVKGEAAWALRSSIAFAHLLARMFR
jgi:hypothetical protein